MAKEGGLVEFCPKAWKRGGESMTFGVFATVAFAMLNAWILDRYIAS